jgi:hypothetical protein
MDAPRARGAFALRTVMNSPWSLRILAESPLTLIAGVSGELWVVPDEGEPVPVGAGDIAITRAPEHYNVADSPTARPKVIIHPDQRCCDVEGNSVLEAMTHGVRTWGNDPDGSTVFLVGASRTSLVRRFHNLVGEPPMTFLKNRRMAMAMDLLCQPDETVSTVAEKVGYATPSAFSAAFKRVRGLRPQAHRTNARR